MKPGMMRPVSPMIDWFDEHGRKHYDPWAKRWVQDDFIPPPAPNDGPGVPTFDLSNVVKLIDQRYVVVPWPKP
jgi:hypothetical protein